MTDEDIKKLETTILDNLETIKDIADRNTKIDKIAIWRVIDGKSFNDISFKITMTDNKECSNFESILKNYGADLSSDIMNLWTILQLCSIDITGYAIISLDIDNPTKQLKLKLQTAKDDITRYFNLYRLKQGELQ